MSRGHCFSIAFGPHRPRGCFLFVVAFNDVFAEVCACWPTMHVLDTDWKMDKEANTKRVASFTQGGQAIVTTCCADSALSSCTWWRWLARTASSLLLMALARCIGIDGSAWLGSFQVAQLCLWTCRSREPFALPQGTTVCKQH